MAGSQLMIHQIQEATVVNFRNRSLLDNASIEAVARELYELVDQQAVRKLVLDFSSVQFLSSQALGMLITLKNKADAIKGQIVLCGLKSDLQRVFKIMNLQKLFKFHDTEQAALAEFNIFIS